jgi:hypothetical protein
MHLLVHHLRLSEEVRSLKNVQTGQSGVSVSIECVRRKDLKYSDTINLKRQSNLLSQTGLKFGRLE